MRAPQSLRHRLPNACRLLAPASSHPLSHAFAVLAPQLTNPFPLLPPSPARPAGAVALQSLPLGVTRRTKPLLRAQVVALLPPRQVSRV